MLPCTCLTPRFLLVWYRELHTLLLLGPGNGYKKINYIRRRSGRYLVLGGFVRGSLWIRDHFQYNIPIVIGQLLGVACLGLLGA